MSGSNLLSKEGGSELYLDSQSKVVTFFNFHCTTDSNKLNLCSKLRRPCVQPIRSKIVIESADRRENDEIVTKPFESNNKQTKMRYDALINLCKNVNWPSGKPQCSQVSK